MIPHLLYPASENWSLWRLNIAFMAGVLLNIWKGQSESTHKIYWTAFDEAFEKSATLPRCINYFELICCTINRTLIIRERHKLKPTSKLILYYMICVILLAYLLLHIVMTVLYISEDNENIIMIHSFCKYIVDL